jgi:hypothetical protein
MYKLERFSYRDHEQRLRVACQWLTDLGVTISATRVGQYSRYLSEIANHYENGTIDALLERHGFPVLVNAMNFQWPQLPQKVIWRLTFNLRLISQ